MTGQLSLIYAPSHAGGVAWRSQLESIRAAVNYLGLKEVAFELDVSGSLLCDALNERDRKRWAGEWTHVVKAMLVAKRDDIASKLLRQLVEGDVANTPFAVDDSEITEAEIAAAEAVIASAKRRGARRR